MPHSALWEYYPAALEAFDDLADRESNLHCVPHDILFTDTAGERVHTLHTTVVGVTAEDVDPAISTAVQNVTMHDVDILAVGESDEAYEKTVRPDGAVRVSEEGKTRTPGTPSFDYVTVGDELPVHHTDCPAATW